ncbi:antitermination protein [Rouxiella sp. WC2420]|uniref:Antitermination protein n=1 Tax=Rouxiella sp. WC2420 TaxID=3234145 RepID=A0AB39VKE2_9GAMM
MSLESSVKYHFPKTQNFTSMPPATASDALSGTDMMGAMGLTQSLAPLGYSAFMGKVGISKNDATRAVSLLQEIALQTCDKVAALRKLEIDIKPIVMQILATYAYLDHCQSAASKKPCPSCQASGFIDAEVFTMKSPFSGGTRRNVREVVRVKCHQCDGKGLVSSSCNDCKGRGRAVSRKLSEEQGVPVLCNCKRCSGRGYERIPSTDAFNAVCQITDALTLDTWKKTIKPFYDELITKLEIEEGYANSVLAKVAR